MDKTELTERIEHCLTCFEEGEEMDKGAIQWFIDEYSPVEGRTVRP